MEETRILLIDSDIELIALITETLDIQDFLRFTSTCKSFRELIEEKNILKYFTGCLRFQRLKIPIRIDKIKIGIRSAYINAMEKSFIELDNVKDGENVFALKDSLVYKGLLKRGYTPSKVVISTYMKYRCNNLGEQDYNVHWIDSFHPKLRLNTIVPIPNSNSYATILDGRSSRSKNPFSPLKAKQLDKKILGLYDPIKDMDYSFVVSINEDKGVYSAGSFCLLSDLVFMYSKEAWKDRSPIEKLLRKASIGISNILQKEWKH